MKWWAALRLRYRILIIVGVVLLVAALAAVIIAISQPGIRTAVVLLAEGLVEVRTGEAESFIDALVDMLLASGDELRTGEDGRSVLELDNGMVVVVSPNSVFYVEEMAGEPENAVTRFILNAGEVFSVSSGTLPEGASYEVETPVGIIGIRGSAMSASYDPDTGSVEATCLTGECSVRTDADEVDLTGNQAIGVTETAGIVGDPAPLTIDDLGRWQGAIDLAEQAGAGDVFGEQCTCRPASPIAGQSVGDLVCEDGTEIPLFVGCGPYFQYDLFSSHEIRDGQFVYSSTNFYGSTNLPASAMFVEGPDGFERSMELGDALSTPRIFYAILPGEPVSGEAYRFTLLDAEGEPFTTHPDGDAYTATYQRPDTWTECLIEGVQNARAAVTPEGDIRLSWDYGPSVPGYDPAHRIGDYTVEVRGHDYRTGSFYEGTSIWSAEHLIPWADFGGEAEGIPDGNAVGLGLSQLDDGDYDIDVIVGSDLAPGNPGRVTECYVSDYAQSVTFTRRGDTITIWPRCECEGRDLACDDGAVTPDAPECGPIPPGSFVHPCEWDEMGAPGVCVLPPDLAPTRILEDFDVGQIGSVAISPDAEQIVFGVAPADGSEGVLYIANADGTDLTALPRLCNDLTPAWSPDGEWLAFHSCGDLALMHPDGAEPHAVLTTSSTGPCFHNPQWSPDSQFIVTVVWPDQVCSGNPTYPLSVEIWVVSLDGETTLPIASLTVEEGDECTWTDAAFSPDGAQVAYTDGACDAWLVSADGSGAPEALEEFPYNWRSDHYPQWVEPEE
jgi:hypothetical protein